jgi:hypothetical protein
MHIIENYVQNLMANLPKKKEPENINLILDGGIFNGSYLIGALYFLREMEKQNYLTINKISSCSIGSVCAVLYQIDALDLMPELYNILLKQFKETRHFHAFKYCLDKIKIRINSTSSKLKLNNVLYITYYDIKKGKKIIKSKYKNVDDLLDAVYKSCFVPFIADGNMVYKNRYCDGVNPYIFPFETNRKTLYLDLFGSDKIHYMLSVKNEKNNFHRILAGLLDIHLFYIKQNSTQMCSYVNQWSLYQTIHNRILKWIVERVIFYVVYISYYLKKYIPSELYEHIIFKIVSKIITELYIVFIDYFCF